jgi:F-type H+-transporting ATPase subunit b
MLIDWFTVGAQGINFLILVWLLKRFLYKPVLSAIDKREKRIAALLAEAEKKKAEALKEQADFQHKNEEFDHQRATLLADANNAAKTERERLMSTARQDAEALHAKLEKANHDQLESLNTAVGELAQKEALSIARKTLTDLAGVNLEQSMVEAFVRRLRSLDEKSRAQFHELLRVSQAPVVRSAFQLSDLQQSSITDALKPFVGEGAKIAFETKPDLVAGIELVTNGQKIAWSISDYLGDLSDALGVLMDSKSSPAPVPPKIVPHAA